MNKKAASVPLMIFEVIVVIAVILLTFSIANSFSNSETVQKIKLVEDIALSVNALIGVPGDALMEYPSQIGLFSLILSSESISILPAEGTKDLPLTRKFRLPQDYQAITENGVLENSAKVCLGKKGKTITLRSCTNE